MAVNGNFCSRTHRLATMHSVTDRRQTIDGRKPVALVRTLQSTVV